MIDISLDDWRAENLRVSTFLLEPLDSESANFWKPLMGAEPEAVHRMPREKKTKEEGSFIDGWLSVEASNIRIDWRLGNDPKNPSRDLPIVGAYAGVYTEFRELMKEWFVQCPPVQRLAYGAVLLCPVEDVSEANELLNQLLPTVDIDRDTSDFLYRINRRRSARSIEGIAINRLSTWSVLSIVGIRLDMPVFDRETPRVAHAEDSSLCRLELDINTAPEFRGEIEEDVLSEVFCELVDLGNEIATKGDVP